jgi:hypothetical protein
MKVIEIRDNFGVDSLQLVERPDPVPGPRQVVLKMRAFSINYRDLLVVNGGNMPRRLGGLGKDRIANPGRGKGKRGGFRYLYVYLEFKHHIHLLFLLDKGEQEDLTAEQQKEIRALVAQLKAAGRGYTWQRRSK